MKPAIEGKTAVVIGSGAGGLSAGILLSLLGYRVTLVEKNDEPGGLMRSYRRGKMDFPVGVHYVGALGLGEPLGRMFDALGLSVEELFYRMGKDGVVDRYVFDDFVFDLPSGIDLYEERLRSCFPSDDAALDRLMVKLRQIACRMMTKDGLLGGGDPFANLDDFRPMGAWLDEINASASLRAVLAAPCHLIGVDLDVCPVVFHHMVVASYLLSAWRLKQNGEVFADAFAGRFKALGGDLLLGQTVKRIGVKEGRVSGVDLSSDETLPADIVVAAIHPKVLISLLPDDTLRPSVRRRIETLEETKGMIAVGASVDAKAHPALDYNIYRLSCNARGMSERGLFCQVLTGDDPGRHLLSVITRSDYQDWTNWEQTQTGHRGLAYEARKRELACQMLDAAGALIGGLTDARLLDVFTPLTLRDYVNCPEGACYGVERSTVQLVKLATLNHLPVVGLCLAGQNAMAPGIMGALLGSFAVVKQIAGADRFRDVFPG